MHSCFLLLAAALSCGVSAEPPTFSVSVQVGQEWRKASPPSFDAQGVPYVSLTSTARQLGASLREADGRWQMDFLGKSASVGINSVAVSAPGGGFKLRHPVLRYDSELLMAASDVQTFLTSAFQATLRAADSSAQTALQQPAQAPLQTPLQTSSAPPPAPPPSVNPDESEAQLAGHVPAPVPAPEAPPPVPSPEAAPPLTQSAAEGEPSPEAPPVTEPPVPAPAPPAPAVETGVAVVVIDPGHGGSDTGCVGAGGLMEKDLTLSLAKLVQQALKGVAGLRVVTTRDDDREVAYRNRINFASVEKASLVVSLHAGASYSPNARGCEVYYPRPTDAAADPGTGISPAWVDSSALAGKMLAESLAAQTESEVRAARPLPLLLFRGMSIPGVMIEVGVLTSPSEEAALKTEAFQQKVAQGIAQGITAALAPSAPQGGTP